MTHSPFCNRIARAWARAIARDRIVIACALCLLTLALASATQAGQRFSNQTLQHENLTRYYDYYLPDSLPLTPVPLVLVLHGGTGDKNVIQAGPYAALEALADSEGFLVAYPNGTSSTTGESGGSGEFNWNDCRSDAGPAATTADDVGFLTALVAELSAQHAIDPVRVFATGASNGGLMSYRLAFEASQTFAAVAALIANAPVNDECPAAPAKPLSVLIMNGRADVIMPWFGGTIFGGRGEVASALETRDLWRGLLATNPTPVEPSFVDVDPNDGSQVELEIYSGGLQGHSLFFYRIIGGGHTIPSLTVTSPPLLGTQNRDIEAANEVWAFFDAVPVPEPGALPGAGAAAATLFVLRSATRRKWCGARSVHASFFSD